MIYIVIPVHNRRAYTLGCLACLTQQTITTKQIIVVDDGSTDGTGEAIAELHPDTMVLTGDGSLWWAGATNLGIRYVLDTYVISASDFILTLNDDTQIAPDYLESLLKTYEQHQPCIVGSVSVDVNDPQRLLYAGTHLNLLFPAIENWADTRFGNRYQSLIYTRQPLLSDSLPGRGMLIPGAVFETIGLFDERRFPHHMADLDFSIRARKAGFALVLSPLSIVYEYPEATGVNVSTVVTLRQFKDALSTLKSPIYYRVRWHFALKHSPVSYLYFVLDMLRILLGYLRRRLTATFPGTRKGIACRTATS